VSELNHPLSPAVRERRMLNLIYTVTDAAAAIDSGADEEVSSVIRSNALRSLKSIGEYILIGDNKVRQCLFAEKGDFLARAMVQVFESMPKEEHWHPLGDAIMVREDEENDDKETSDQETDYVDKFFRGFQKFLVADR